MGLTLDYISESESTSYNRVSCRNECKWRNLFVLNCIMKKRRGFDSRRIYLVILTNAQIFFLDSDLLTASHVLVSFFNHRKPLIFKTIPHGLCTYIITWWCYIFVYLLTQTDTYSKNVIFYYFLFLSVYSNSESLYDLSYFLGFILQF